ncbi:MAG: hypothetical protein ACK4GQ_03015 [Candidatus Hadarchaeales archaeon]
MNEVEPEFRLTRAGKIKWKLKKNWKRLTALCLSLAIVLGVYILTFVPPEISRKAKITAPYVLPPSEGKRGFFAVPKYHESGIENIYIVKFPRFDPQRDMMSQLENVDAIIHTVGQTVDVSDNALFAIVVAVRAKAPDDIAYVAKENMWLWLRATGAFTIPNSLAPDWKEYVFESSGYGTANGYMRVNVVWDNDGEGYILYAGQHLFIDNLELKFFSAK